MNFELKLTLYLNFPTSSVGKEDDTIYNHHRRWELEFVKKKSHNYKIVFQKHIITDLYR